MIITIKYSCHACGIKATELCVPARKEGQDIINYMESLGVHIQQDHLSISPKCKARTAQDLMIPVNSANVIGGPALH